MKYLMVRKEIFSHLFILIVFFLLFCFSSVYSSDELFLTGVVKQIDLKRSLVTVEVTSKSCSGDMKIRVDDISMLEGSTGKKISFFINASACDLNTIHSSDNIIFLKR